MRVRKNLTMGGLIMLIVVACLAGAGYLWFSHARTVRIREERAAKVAASEAKIIVYEDEIKKLEADKKPLDEEAAAIDAKIKAATEKAEASAAKLKEWNGHLADFRKKMDDSRREVDQYNRNLQSISSSNGRTTQSAGSSQVASAERSLAALQKELEKVTCHYECMGRSKPSSKARPSDEGTWVFDKNNKPLYWICKKHRYQFTEPIGYLDYKNEASRLGLEIGKLQRQIAELKNQSSSETVAQQEAATTAKFNAEAWNAKLKEANDVVEKVRTEADADRKALDALNSEKRELESKLKDIERRIEDNESRIKNERLYIAENKR